MFSRTASSQMVNAVISIMEGNGKRILNGFDAHLNGNMESHTGHSE
jgi:hypothetical protein